MPDSHYRHSCDDVTQNYYPPPDIPVRLLPRSVVFATALACYQHEECIAISHGTIKTPSQAADSGGHFSIGSSFTY